MKKILPQIQNTLDSQNRGFREKKDRRSSGNNRTAEVKRVKMPGKAVQGLFWLVVTNMVTIVKPEMIPNIVMTITTSGNMEG